MVARSSKLALEVGKNQMVERPVIVEVGNPAAILIKESGVERHQVFAGKRNALVVHLQKPVLPELNVLNGTENAAASCQVG